MRKGPGPDKRNDITWLPERDRARQLAFVFQENYTGFPYTVQEIVLMGRHPHQDSFFFDNAADFSSAHSALSMVGMEGFANRHFRTLSGGEKQRVAIAAALAQSTPIILFDEPTAYTDIKYQSEIYKMIHHITRERNLTSLVVTHDINLASLYCDTVSVLHQGRIVASGRPADIFTEELLSTTYGFAVRIIKHPEEGVPIIIPYKTPYHT